MCGQVCLLLLNAHAIFECAMFVCRFEQKLRALEFQRIRWEIFREKSMRINRSKSRKSESHLRRALCFFISNLGILERSSCLAFWSKSDARVA